MIDRDLLSRFLAEKVTDQVRDLILGELAGRTSGLEYLTFNVMNVRLDSTLK